MNRTSVTPLISINNHGYQRTTLPGRKTIKPLNLRIDQQAHDHLETIQAYYDRITGLKVRPSVIMRRAIETLAEHIRIADPADEQAAIVDCSHMGDIHCPGLTL